MARISSLGEFVRVRTGKLDANAAHENGKYPFFTCSKEPLAINTYSFDCECVLLAGNGEFHVSYYSGPFDAYQRTYIIESLDVERLSVPYLYYFMRYYSAELRKLSVGGVIKFIKLGNIKDAPIPMPTISEQRRIVDLLSRAEGIVRLRREAEKKAAELIPALFLDMFGDPATNPKGWQMKPLQSVAEVGSGNGFPNTYQGKTEGEFPFYKVSDMNTKGNEVEMLGANNYISAEDLNALRAKAFPVGTVIFPKIGAAIATNKKRMLTQPSCFDNNVMGITVGRDLLPTYVHALMVSKNLSDFASDSNPPSIRKTTVEAWEIPVPQISLQSEFANHVETIRSIQNQQSTATAKAQATFDALLAKAFSNNGANV